MAVQSALQMFKGPQAQAAEPGHGGASGKTARTGGETTAGTQQGRRDGEAPQNEAFGLVLAGLAAGTVPPAGAKAGSVQTGPSAAPTGARQGGLSPAIALMMPETGGASASLLANNAAVTPLAEKALPLGQLAAQTGAGMPDAAQGRAAPLPERGFLTEMRAALMPNGKGEQPAAAPSAVQASSQASSQAASQAASQASSQAGAPGASTASAATLAGGASMQGQNAERSGSEGADPRITAAGMSELSAGSGRATEAAAPKAAPGTAATTQAALQTASLLRSGKDSLRFELTPADLGRVTIRLKIKDGQTRLLIAVEKPAALEALRIGSPGLHAALQNAGVDMDQRDIRFELEGGGHNDFAEKGQDGEPRREQGQGSAGTDEEGRRLTGHAQGEADPYKDGLFL